MFRFVSFLLINFNSGRRSGAFKVAGRSARSGRWLTFSTFSTSVFLPKFSQTHVFLPSPPLPPPARSAPATIGALSLNLTDLATSTVNFSESETLDVEYLNSLSQAELSNGAADSSVPNVMTRLSSLLSTQVSTLTSVPEALNLLLVEALDYESSQMADFNALAKHVERLASENDRNER